MQREGCGLCENDGKEKVLTWSCIQPGVGVSAREKMCTATESLAAHFCGGVDQAHSTWPQTPRD